VSYLIDFGSHRMMSPYFDDSTSLIFKISRLRADFGPGANIDIFNYSIFKNGSNTKNVLTFFLEKCLFKKVEKVTD